MEVEFLEIAKAELDDAFEWYESLKKGLGFEFNKEVDKSILSIISFPKVWRLVAKEIRRCIINRFPFFLTILY